VRVAAEAVAVTMIVIVVVRMVVAVAVAIVRMAAGFLGLVVHPLDSNRDSVCLTAWILGASAVDNGVDRGDRRERTRWPKRN
jgi:hypothetical protein